MATNESITKIIEMQIKNTPENKARFFALYWGQNVRFWTLNGSDILSKITHTYMTKAILESCTLELTLLSQITDEDLEELAIILSYRSNEYFIKNFGRSRKQYLRDLIKDGLKFNYLGSVSQIVKAIDYLRSRGYYVGDGIEIEHGWVKRKEDKL